MPVKRKKRREKAVVTKRKRVTKRESSTKKKPTKKAVKKVAKKATPKRPAPKKPAKKRPTPRQKKADRNRKARERRAELRYIREAELASKLDERRQRRKRVDSERAHLEGILEDIRNTIASVYPVSLGFTEAETASKTPWLIVGRFDFFEDVSYAELGDAFEALANDLILETRVHPDRLSQIRIIYNDPSDKRGSGDSIVSRIGGWQVVISDILSEILGSGEADEDALATRYRETKIQTFYIYFSSEIVEYETVGPWSATKEIKMRQS